MSAPPHRDLCQQPPSVLHVNDVPGKNIAVPQVCADTNPSGSTRPRFVSAITGGGAVCADTNLGLTQTLADANHALTQTLADTDLQAARND